MTGGCTRTWDGDLVVRVLGRSVEKLEELAEKIVKMGTDWMENLYLL